MRTVHDCTWYPSTLIFRLVREVLVHRTPGIEHWTDPTTIAVPKKHHATWSIQKERSKHVFGHPIYSDYRFVYHKSYYLFIYLMTAESSNMSGNHPRSQTRSSIGMRATSSPLKHRLISISATLKLPECFESILIGFNMIGNNTNESDSFHTSIRELRITSKFGKTLDTVLQVWWQNRPICDDCVRCNSRGRSKRQLNEE